MKTTRLFAYLPLLAAAFAGTAYADASGSMNPLTLANPPVASTAYYYVGDGWNFGAQMANSVGTVEGGVDTLEKNTGIYGFAAGIHVGYGYTFSDLLYLGAEAYANKQDVDFTRISSVFSASNTDSSVSSEIGNSFGISILPGYHFSGSSLVYLRLGLNYAELSSLNNLTNATNYDIYKPAPEIGFGVREALTQNLSLALEYDWLKYYQQDMVANDATDHFSASVFQLSLNYQLDNMDPHSTGNFKLQLTGPYAGAQFGPETLLARDYVSWFPGTGKYVADSGSTNGVAGQLHAGYGYAFNNWAYLGAEGFYQNTFNSVTIDQLGMPSFAQSQSYGFSILPGYIINPSNLAFLRLGWIRSEFVDVTSAGQMGGLFDTWLSGYEVGLGYEIAVYQNLSLVAEYDYSAYQPTSQFTDQGGIARSSRISFSDNYFGVGLNYRF